MTAAAPAVVDRVALWLFDRGIAPAERSYGWDDITEHARAQYRRDAVEVLTLAVASPAAIDYGTALLDALFTPPSNTPQEDR